MSSRARVMVELARKIVKKIQIEEEVKENDVVQNETTGL